MKIITTIEEIQALIGTLRKEGKNIGFVPTMGYLHRGHLSLLEKCQQNCDVSVVSIYVNRSQFNESKDFESYPRDFEKDKVLLKQFNCDLLFMPTETEIEKLPLQYKYEANGAEVEMEGKYRGGHFKGVMEVVGRLFDAVNPDIAYFGEKDYQQYAVLKSFGEVNGFNIRIESVPTQREADGLAMSSRNVRLNEDARKVASLLYKEMLRIKEKADRRDLHELISSSKNSLKALGFDIDYLKISDMRSKKRLFAAASLGGVRLIDNISIED